MTPGEDQKASEMTSVEENSNALDITPNKDGGVLKTIIKPGVGEETPQKSNTVFVHYTGKLLDGTVFDTSRARNEEFKFVLGTGSVIKGWDIGVATMKKGEICRLTCKPEYAYGENGSPPKIPPNSTLVFDVELIDWELEDVSPANDGSIKRRIITAGELYTTPKQHATVTVHVKGEYNQRIFDDRELEFIVAEASEYNLVKGVELAIQKMKKGEKSLFRITSKFAFGSEGHKEWDIPPNATVDYIIHLKSFENAKEAWDMDVDEKIEQSGICKSKGTNFLKAGKYELALQYYKRAVDLLEHEENLEGEKKEKRDALMLANYLNTALCHLKVDNFHDTIAACTSALALDPKNEKALFRRGQAYVGTKEFDVALKDFEQVLKVDANNKAARNQLSICQTKLSQELQREKQFYKSIFDKMAARSKAESRSDAPIETGVWNNGQAEEPSPPEEAKMETEVEAEPSKAEAVASA
uniref:peptidylprolyl isomerase n=1 Tax=Ornithodoros turicata TaxID=34597 RepID=A0A2R5LG15_9ACAR